MKKQVSESNPDGIPYLTDLACERRRADTKVNGVEYTKEITVGGVFERIKISSPEGAKSIGRPMGIYDTLHTSRMDLLDSVSIEDAKEQMVRELYYIFEESGIIPERLLVVGLGNPALTPDSLGTECAITVKPTLHISELDNAFFKRLDSREIAVFSPGVAATSGLESAVAVKGVCDAIAPDAVIAIDSLASRSVERLGSTVQVSNTGIHPGTAMGADRLPLTKDTLGVPVIAIGVPTVIDSRLFSHVDGPMKYPPMLVSPKEINEIIKVAGKIIGESINEAFGLPF